jgi:hypothetical protein
LLADSPAIDRGDPVARPGEDGVPTSDQRLSPFIRVYGGRIDIGAFERQPAGLLPGDFNGNGIVDGADYAMWRRTTGSKDAMALVVDARGNGDGRVDYLDHRLWISNFGTTKLALGSGGVVEESATDAFVAKDVAQSPPMGSSMPHRPSPKRRSSIAVRSRIGTAEARDEVLIDWSSRELIKNHAVDAGFLAPLKFDSVGEPFNTSSFESAIDTVLSSVGLNEEIRLATVVKMKLRSR